MKEEIEAIVNLAVSLHDVSKQRKINLIDQERKLIIARLDFPGSLYDTLKNFTEMDISYAEIIHSYEPIPSLNRELEIQRFEFERKNSEKIVVAEDTKVPPRIS